MRRTLSAARLIALAAFAALGLQLPRAWADPASVGAYYSLGAENGQSALYMDRNFVIPYRGQKIARLTTVYATPQTAKGLSTPYAIGNVGMEFDCDQSRYELVGLTLFDAAGNKLYEQPADLAWSAISQGSPAARMRGWACGLTAWPEAPFVKGTLADLRQAYLRSASKARTAPP